jgi:hypothetical protein
MTIEYKNPYWIKYEWDVGTIQNGSILKKDNFGLQNILFKDKYSIICNFKIKEGYIKDEKAGIFGKAGQNFGLTFDSKIDSLVFEFRTNTESPEFHCLIFDKIKFKDIKKGVNLIITKNKNSFGFYLNGKLKLMYAFNGTLIDEYKDAPFFLGALNPGAKDPKDRCYSQIDFNLFAIVENETNVNVLDKIKPNDNKVICYYDFKRINIIKNVCDESNNYNFMELVPKEYVI